MQMAISNVQNIKTPKHPNGKYANERNYNLSDQPSNPEGVECE
jgi:hypothetical protein